MPTHDQLVIEKFSAQVERLTSSPHLTADEPLQWFMQALPLAASDRVLDLGCASGLLTLELARHCATVIGVDMTPAMIERARIAANDKGRTNASFVVGDARTLDFPNESFDAVVSRLALHHMPEPERAIAEAARVLRPHGTIGIFDMATAELAAEALVHNEFETLRDPSHQRALPISELLAYLGRSGFEVTDVRSQTFEFELEDYIARADQSAAEARAARELIAQHYGKTTFLARKIRRDAEGRYYYAHRWYISVARKLAA